jgi:hypothetical protein
MKKILFFLATVLVFASCENWYIDKHLGGSDFNPTDVRTIDYTLNEADYKAVVENTTNQELALAKLVTDTLGVVDSTAYFAFLQIAENLAFSGSAPAEVYVPALLVDKFPQLSPGSIVNLTYGYLTADGIVESKSTFSLSDVWGSSIYYKQAIAGEGQGKLVIQDVIMDPALSYVWKYDAKYGMKATAYVGGKNYPSQSWVVTPAIDLGRAKNPQLSFDQARKYGVDFLKECFVMASTDYAGDVTQCTWDTIPFNKDENDVYIVPDGSSWNFMSTGDLDLSKYVGQKVYIGFQYNSSELGSATWEFKNLLVAEPQE